MPASIHCEDDCCAAIADYLFGKCEGHPTGYWSEILKNLLKCNKIKIAIIDNDNEQVSCLRNYGFELKVDNPDFQIYEKDGKYVIVLKNSCEEFLKRKEKIKDKRNPRFTNDQKYKLNILKRELEKLGII